MKFAFRAALILVASFSFCSMNSHQSRADLVTNGSFELGTFDNNDQDPRPDIKLLFPGQIDLPGWSVVGSSGVHWMDSTLAGSAPSAVSDGIRSIDLQGLNPGELTAFSTNISTTPGLSYTLRFDAYSGLDTTANTATVSVGSLTNQLFSGGTGPSSPFCFETLSYEFQAIDSVSTLTFQVTASNGYGPVIDNVVVTAVPEPTSVALMGASLVAAVIARRRHRK